MIKTKSVPKKLPLPKLLKKAQILVNRFIRERDKSMGCISCGSEVTQAGHYRSQGHYSSLRFHEWNINGQCTKCNVFLHGNLIEYRRGLIERYGDKTVGYLENEPAMYKWSREELNEIIEKYK